MSKFDKNITPFAPVYNPNYFVGRANELNYAYHSVENGSTLMITGERGIGKTSLGKMLEHKLISEKNYKSIWVSCSTIFHGGFDNLMIQIVESLLTSESKNPNISKLYEDFKIIKSKKSDSNYDSIRTFDFFEKAISILRNGSLVLFIDDIEVLRDFNGIANLIKLNPDRLNIRLVLIGVELSNILKEHPSIQRVTQVLVLNRFNKAEIDQFVKIYFANIKNNTDRLPSYYIDLIAKLSDGTPRLLHLLLRMIFEYQESKDILKLSEKDVSKMLITHLLEQNMNPFTKEQYYRILKGINNKGKEDIIRYLLSSTEKCSIIDIEKQLTSKYRFERNIQELLDDKVITIQNNAAYFYDAFYKILLEYYESNHKLDFNEFKKITLPNNVYNS